MISILKHTRRPDITFFSDGRIDISANITRLLELAKGDVINVMQDNNEYYLYVCLKGPVRGRHEGMVFPSRQGSSSFRAASKTLCSHFLKICNATSKVRLCVGEPYEHPVHGLMLPIITKLLLNG